MSASSHRNALAGETSPYLLAHATNPVDWYPWGEQALELARASDKPILLSIGYSACHWCHVMAHESFEDEATAALMNRHFVNIKVDREERPDLDRIYQSAHLLLVGRGGGWPLTVFLSPDDQAPFFAGTYFPPEPRHRMPSFRDLLEHIARAWREQREALRGQNRALLEALRRMDAPSASPTLLEPTPLIQARTLIAESFDADHGGFGAAPRFPNATLIERLLRDHAGNTRDGKPGALEMATRTLRHMAEGGIYDHLGGGFCRYSVDDRWMIPHFEKMLYDNAALLALYAWAWQVTAEPLFRERALETAGWMMREMQSPSGGFWSSLDADSEGEEGRYYLWQPEQVRALLDADEYALIARRYGLDRPANFEGRLWNLHGYESIDAIAASLGQPRETLAERLRAARARLLVAREQRVHPARDEKILTAWNALAIKGLAVAGRVLEEPALVDAATRALDFLRARLWRDGRLLAVFTRDHAHLPAYLDDHAFLIDAILALLEARWRDGDLQWCIDLAELLLAHFAAPEGGFYFTADDREALLHRPRPMADEALPSGNGVAAFALNRLGHLCGETRYIEAAERTLRSAGDAFRQYPHAHCTLLAALEETLDPPQVVVLRGAGEALERFARRAAINYAPRRLTLAIADDAGALPGLLAMRAAPPSGVMAWVCSGHHCDAPSADFAVFEAALRDHETPRPG